MSTTDLRNIAFVALCLTLGTSACRGGPKVASSSKAVQAGGMKFRLKGYEIRRPELSEDGRTHLYEKGVLALRLAIENTGSKPFEYDPPHETEAMTEASTPLLYRDPGKNVPLPPKSKKIIPGVVLEEGAVPDQIRKTTSIAPDSTVEDLFLFEVPDSKQANLIFSIPPSFHRGTAPILFRLQYEYRQPPGPKVHEIGDEIAFDGVVFRVNAAKLSYAELTHPEKGKGFSDKPVFAVSYTITNESDSSVQYEPGHTAVSGIRAAQLKGPDEFFARKRFPSGMKVVGQTSGSMEIKPSSSTSDVAIFEKPGKGIDTLTFRYPATRFGRSGLVRVRIPYEHEVPKPPKPLRSASGEDK